MKLSTLAQLINRTIELSGDCDLNRIVTHNNKDNRINIVIPTLELHRAELTIMIDPAWDSQKGVTLHLSNHSLDHGFTTESVYTVWDTEQGEK